MMSMSEPSKDSACHPLKTLPRNIHERVWAAYPDPLEASELLEQITSHYDWLVCAGFLEQVDRYVELVCNDLECEAKKHRVLNKTVRLATRDGKMVLIHAIAIVVSAYVLLHLGMHA